MYGYWWHKPFCVLHPIRISFDDPRIVEHIYSSYIAYESTLQINKYFPKAAVLESGRKIRSSRRPSGPGISATAPVVRTSLQQTAQTDFETGRMSSGPDLVAKQPEADIEMTRKSSHSPSDPLDQKPGTDTEMDRMSSGPDSLGNMSETDLEMGLKTPGSDPLGTVCETVVEIGPKSTEPDQSDEVPATIKRAM